MTAWMQGLRALLPFHGVTSRMNFAQMHADLMQVREFLVEIERKLEAAMKAEMERPKSPPVPTTDEYVAVAETATAVYKALEAELGIDRRTILGKVERLVKAHSLEARFPDYSRSVELAKYLAERMPDGRLRIQHALEALA